jgi:hypothetical protein
LQRYHPAIDLFKIPDSVYSQKNLELASKYQIHSWMSSDSPKIWNTVRTHHSESNTSEYENCKTFVKVIHLLNPIDMIKEKYTCPEHPLIPQSENTWKKTLQKIHNHNNQAYVDTVANFVLSRFRELNLTPHCIFYYGSATGISKSYQYNISNEYDSYRQCRWFWTGLTSHNANLTVINNEEIQDFDELYKEIVTCPFDDDVSDVELDIIDVEMSEGSINSYTFDNIEENADNVNDIFEINHKITGKNLNKPYDELNGSDYFDDSDESDESDDSNESADVDVDILMEIPNMPVILIYQEAQEGVLDNLLEEDEIDGFVRGSQGWESRWIAWLFQIIAALSFLQNAICFTHNDLHSNNILWRKTDKKFLYYRGKDGTNWRIPTYGKIFCIIDFGRSIFRLGKHLWVSDDHWPDQDAGDQYNFGPFFDHTRPKVSPNPSFDLCRLSVSLIDGLFEKPPPKKKGKVSIMSEEDSWKVYETSSSLYNLLWNWTVDKNGHTVYQNENGSEKYEGFDLYIRIAHDVQNAVPKDQIHKPIFQQFKWKQKIPKEETVYSIGA